MLKDIEYPSGFGPDNSQPLEIKNTFMIDIPPGHAGTVRLGAGGDWEQSICIYSVHSGAKVWEGNCWINIETGTAQKNAKQEADTHNKNTRHNSGNKTPAYVDSCIGGLD